MGDEGNILGKNLREFRQARGLKQEQVAEGLSMPPATYSSWERGRTEPNLEGLIKLARYFDVSIDRLLLSESRPLKIGSNIPVVSKNFHPIKSLDGIYDSIYPLIFNRLYFFDIYRREFNLELIDESWPVLKGSADDLRYTFHLRDKVEFHSGALLTLEDIKCSYELFLDQFPFFKKFIDCIIIVEGQNTIELKLQEMMKPEHLPTPYIIPKGCIEADECFDGTGPFKLTSEEQQDRVRKGLKHPVTFESNSLYFGKIPEIQTIEFHKFADDATLCNALGKGVVDLAHNLDMVESDKFNIEPGQGSMAFYLVLSQTSELSQVVDFRKAVDSALDRNRIIELIGINKERLLPDSHLYLHNILRDPYIDGKDNYNPSQARLFWKKAKEFLSKRNITNPILRIGASIRDQRTQEYGKVTSDIIEEIIRQLEEVDIESKKEYDEDKIDAWVEVIAFGKPAAVHQKLHSSQNSGRPWHYSNTEVDYLLDNTEGIEGYPEIQKILDRDYVFLPLFRREVAITYTRDLNIKSRLRVTKIPYGPDIAHWKFR